MEWLITGAKGMLGQDLVRTVVESGHSVTAVDIDELDITDPNAVAAIAPCDVIVNCAAFTAVDAAEEREDFAFTLNATAPQLLARAANARGARMVQISTDYVFGGDGTEPYAEDAELRPLSAYGRTKAAGEWAVRANCADHLIVRTAWLYGAGGNCFPKTMARLASERDSLSVVTDEYGQPTWTVDLADLILRLVASGAPSGTYHGTSSGETNWFGFTQEIVESAGRPASMVGPTTASAFARPAPRPSYSVLGHDALNAVGVTPIGHWRGRWYAAADSVLGLSD